MKIGLLLRWVGRMLSLKETACLSLENESVVSVVSIQRHTFMLSRREKVGRLDESSYETSLLTFYRYLLFVCKVSKL